jgi:phosphopantetheinyl transferase
MEPHVRKRALAERSATMLTAGAVHVWHADLDDPVAAPRAHLISRDERERAAQIVSEPRSRRWARTRGILRELLGVYLGADPRALRFETSPDGKPSLSQAPAERLRFNLSHSRSLALFALTLGREVGVDIEVVRDASARARGRDFLRAWTREEALAKLSGGGVLLRARAAARADHAPWQAELDVGDRAVAAIALSQEPAELVVHDWNAEVR